MATQNNSNSQGISFLGLLAIVFITLKLTHFIEWSWLWVLAPLWMPISLVILVLGFFLLITLLKK